MEIDLTKKIRYEQLVKQIYQNKSETSRNIYEIGLALKEIRDRKLYLVDDVPLIENFEEFLEKKVSIAKTTAFKFIKVSEQFSLREFEKWGVTKLDILLTEIPDVDIRREYINENVPLPEQKFKASITTFQIEHGLQIQSEILSRNRIAKKPSLPTQESKILKMRQDGDWILTQISTLKKNKKLLKAQINEWNKKVSEIKGLKPLKNEIKRCWDEL